MAYTRNLQSFLNHRSRESTSTQYLSGWRNRTPPEITCFLHTQVLPVPVWQHNWPKIVDKRDGTKAVWGGSFACLESEAVLKKQRYRDKKTGRREVPPEICPICILNEYVRDAIREGHLDWTDVLFRYRAGEDQRILHAAGIFNGYSLRTPTQEQLDQISKAGIKLGGDQGAWREDATAKCKYVFRVVAVDEVDKGVQIAVEQELLGQKVQACIAREIERAMGPKDPEGEGGNPLSNPYAIKFKYFPTEREFGKRYDAVAMPNVELTEEIRALIYDTPPPSLDRVREAWNIRAMRALMEDACEFQLDFDEIFGPVEAKCDASGMYLRPKDEEDEDSVDSAEVRSAPPAPPAAPAAPAPAPAPPPEPAKKALGKPSGSKPKPAPKAPEPSEPKTTKRRPAPPPEPAPEPAPEPEATAETEPCVGRGGKCGYPLPPDCLKCPKCGQVYALEDDSADAVEPPPWDR